MSLTLTNIPRIMTTHGWVKGAALMNRWFRGRPTRSPRYAVADTSTVRMDWMLRFARAKQVYDALVTDAIWANAAAQNEIAKMLKRQAFPATGTSKPFGNLSDATQNQHKDYVNFRAFTDGGAYGSYYNGYYGYYYGYSSDIMDDLTAALGRFVFHVVVAGDVKAIAATKGAPTYQATIREVGIYVRDTYDSNGSQPLRFWDDAHNSVSMLNFLSGTYVNNESFRDWRTTNHRGGDFEIFTDLRRIVLARPVSFAVA